MQPGRQKKMAVATGAVAVDMESAGSASRPSNTSSHSQRYGSWRIHSHRTLPPATLSERLIDGATDLSAVWRSIRHTRSVQGLLRLALDTRTARAALVRTRRLLGHGFGLHSQAS